MKDLRCRETETAHAQGKEVQAEGADPLNQDTQWESDSNKGCWLILFFYPPHCCPHPPPLLQPHTWALKMEQKPKQTIPAGPACLSLFLWFSFFLGWGKGWKLNLGPCTYQESVLPLSTIPSPLEQFHGVLCDMIGRHGFSKLHRQTGTAGSERDLSVQSHHPLPPWLCLCCATVGE